ncbi:hypothetical protein BKI52_08980 [marine bacterium AO1-C]|nr:hypothetical protein BKI52_08980 [marine bacterium AO1-C]
MHTSKLSFVIFLIVGLLICVAVQKSFAQVGFRVNYNYMNPTGEMGNTIQEAHGVNLEGTYHLKQTPITLGVDFGFGRYGAHRDFSTPIVFNNRTINNQNLEVRSELLSGFFTAKIDLYPQGIIQPYLNAKIGWQLLYSRFFFDGLNRSEREIMSDHALTGGLGGGIKISLSKIFGLQLDAFNNVFLNLEANYLLGSQVNYLSVNPPNDQVQPTHNNGFGNVYKTRNQLTEIKIGFGFGF